MLHNAFVLDNGAYTIKAGFSGADSPRIMPNCIMKAKSEKRRAFIADQIDDCRDLSGLYYLLGFQKGFLINWDIQKTVWDYIFSKDCCDVNFKEMPLIFTEPYYNFNCIQEGITEIFFEEYDCQSLLRINAGDLSAYHYQTTMDRQFCLLVDSGYSYTYIVPYINGKKYKKGIIRLDVGGKSLTNSLKEMISYRQLHVMDETYVVNQVKEDVCFVSQDFKADMEIARKKYPENTIIVDYILPDFTMIKRGYPVKLDTEISDEYQTLRLSNERFTVPEILFEPSDIGINSIGISLAIVQSISKCESDVQPALYDNILLTGGCSKFPGFKDRIYKDVRSMSPEEFDVNVYLPDDPIGYAWHGGALLSKNPDFYTFVVTKEEYSEEGFPICKERFDI